MTTIYVETNFVLELAFAQEQAESCCQLLDLCDRGKVSIVLPAFSVGECFTTLARRISERRRLADVVSRERKQLSRSIETRTELTAVDSFIALLIESLEADKQRLDTTLNRLLAIASVIPLDKSVVINAAEHRSCFGLQHQDSLVYSSVLHHLQTTPSHQSCFLNRNSKDFDDPDIIESFQALNCKMLFRFDHGLNHVISLLS
jgi:predicted nucleic acid-binding protein